MHTLHGSSLEILMIYARVVNVFTVPSWNQKRTHSETFFESRFCFDVYCKPLRAQKCVANQEMVRFSKTFSPKLFIIQCRSDIYARHFFLISRIYIYTHITSIKGKERALCSNTHAFAVAVDRYLCRSIRRIFLVRAI